MTTTISWTDVTWNPTTGCDRISPGCAHCYALTMAGRLKHMGVRRYQNDGGSRSGPGFALTMHPDRIDQPRRWRKPRRIFVNSMSDLFHREVSREFLRAVWDTMLAADHHIYQILTKRPHRMQWRIRDVGLEPAPHIWLGVSVENQRLADYRLPQLMRVSAGRRFVSAEPLLEPIALAPWLGDLDWVIVGAESGGNRRPFDKDWAREIRDDCERVGKPFHFKQGSNLRPGQDRLLDGRMWDDIPALATIL